MTFLYGTNLTGQLQQLLYNEFAVLAIAYARVAPVFYLLPFLSDRMIVNMTLRNTIIFVVIVGLWHGIGHPHPTSTAALLELALQEATAGLVLGVTLSLPFWVAAAIGELIDNQRGATLSASIDPATGVEASVFAPFLSLFYAAVFLQQGGMVVIVRAIYDSYVYLPVGALLRANIWRFGSILTELVASGLSLAAPVLLAVFLADVMLGLLSRLCPQVNAFSLSLSVKSIAAFVVFHLYFAQAGPHALSALVGAHTFSSMVQ